MLSWRSSSLPTVPQGAASNYQDLLSEQGVRRFREALGRSRGRVHPKIHLAADQRWGPSLSSPARVSGHDSIAFETVLAEVRIDRVGPGRPRTRPDWVLADKAYSSKANRDHLTGRGIKAAIPIKDDQAAGRRKKKYTHGRPPDFDKQRYRDRNTVERAVNKLRGCRATATRYDKRDYVYRGTIAVTSIWIWIRNPRNRIVRHGLVAPFTPDALRRLAGVHPPDRTPATRLETSRCRPISSDWFGSQPLGRNCGNEQGVQHMGSKGNRSRQADQRDLDEAAVRAAIAAERTELADVLDGLSPERWDEPSLCAGWRVREVVAHITMAFRYSLPQVMIGILRARGSFHRMADRAARRDAEELTSDQLAECFPRSNVNHPWKPPGGGHVGALSHDLIHGLDITVALGLDRQPPAERVGIVLGSLSPKQVSYFGVDLNGVQLRANDLDWSYGSGEPLIGSVQDLLLLVCGRKLPPGLLHGEAAPRFTH